MHLCLCNQANIIPGQGIGSIRLNMYERDLIEVLGSYEEKKETAEGYEYRKDSLSIWVNKKSRRVVEITAHIGFNGMLFGKIKPGSTLRELEEFGNVCCDDALYPSWFIRGMENMSFEMVDDENSDCDAHETITISTISLYPDIIPGWAIGPYYLTMHESVVCNYLHDDYEKKDENGYCTYCKGGIQIIIDEATRQVICVKAEPRYKGCLYGEIYPGCTLDKLYKFGTVKRSDQNGKFIYTIKEMPDTFFYASGNDSNDGNDYSVETNLSLVIETICIGSDRQAKGETV